MATQPIGYRPPTSSSRWYPASPTYSRAYLLAGVRAGLIALALLAILVVLILL